jgi:hypothetical protein
MTKTELNKALIEGLKERGVSEEAIAFADSLTKPKVGGGSSDVNDYTVYDEEGKPTYIFCTYHKKWEPVYNEDGEPLFKINDKSKNGFARECNDGLAAWREQAKVYKATKDAAISDLLEGAIDNERAKEIIAEAEAERAKHTDREDGLGTEEKPEGFELDSDD